MSTSDARDRLQAALGTAYSLERELGRGGMATVYLARDMKHYRLVALKVLHPEVAASLGPDRFRREIELAAGLQHPHILSVFDSGETVAGQLWFTMPYVEGESLRDRLRRTKQLPLDDAVRITREVAGALAYAHQHGVIHRDIKPENILLTTQGDALLADFGIARALAADPSPGGTLTQTGTAVGTPQYMSPEQAAGERDLTPQTDIYSLGAVCYEMLTGEPPFTGATAQAVIAKMIASAAPSPRTVRPSVPEAVDQTVRTALAPVPADRFSTAADFARTLGVAERTTTVETGRAGPSPAPPAGGWRFPLAAASLALGLLIGGGALFAWRSHGHARGTPEDRPSIAVLPFDNVGDSADAYFADGVTDAVRGKLTALNSLTVVARATSAQYRHTTKSPQLIARELGVRYLLTGQVRWQKLAGGKSRVRVDPELVQVGEESAPTSKWQQAFDADLSDVFSVQADIAGKVATALNVVLGDQQQQQLAERPTGNLDAYDAYLRGENATQGMGVRDVQSLRRGAGFYTDAVTRDSGFALAWAQLARAHALLYYYGGQPPAEAEAARRAAERAQALAPDRPESHLAAGDYATNVRADAPGARAAFVAGLQRAPGNVDLLTDMALAEQTLGQWDSALVYASRARALDPRSVAVARRLSVTLHAMRRYPEALAAFDRVLALSPNHLQTLGFKPMVFLDEGDLDGARAALNAELRSADTVAVLVEVVGGLFGTFWMLDSGQQQRVLGLPPAAFDNDRGPWALARAEIYWLRGDSARMRAYGDTARQVFAERVRVAPEATINHARLGLALAYAGRNEEAVREGERAADLMPVSRDALDGPPTQEVAGRIDALAHRPEKAVDHLAAAIRTPSVFSSAMFRIDPDFAVLRGNPRFEQLIATPPSTPRPAP